MRVEDEGRLLRIFVDEKSRWEGKPLYERIVQACLDAGLAGATVLRGIQGYGAHHRLRVASVLRLSTDLPVVIEVADTPEKIESFLPAAEAMIDNGFITVEKVRMIRITPDD